MDPVTIAISLLGAGAEVAKLAAAALDAARAGDDNKALELLDAAIAKGREQVAAADAELDAVKQRVAERIAAKFDTTDKPTS